jgi:hypothetical protein
MPPEAYCSLFSTAAQWCSSLCARLLTPYIALLKYWKLLTPRAVQCRMLTHDPYSAGAWRSSCAVYSFDSLLCSAELKLSVRVCVLVSCVHV